MSPIVRAGRQWIGVVMTGDGSDIEYVFARRPRRRQANQPDGSKMSECPHTRTYSGVRSGPEGKFTIHICIRCGKKLRETPQT